MKLRYNIIIAIASVFALFSCADMMDVHQEYIKDGETVYAPKLDSLAFHSGNGRIDFVYWFNYAPHVEKIMVFWDNNADSLVIPVSPGAEEFNDSTIISNLPEKSYTFSTYTVDKHGNKSLVSSGFSTSYGEYYISGLEHRRVLGTEKTIYPETDSVECIKINLDEPSSYVVESVITYTTTSGEIATVTVPRDEYNAYIVDIDITKACDLETICKPDEYCIDEFTPVDPYTFNIEIAEDESTE